MLFYWDIVTNGKKIVMGTGHDMLKHGDCLPLVHIVTCLHMVIVCLP